MVTRIFVTHRFPALHRYPAAPKAVAFLASNHRHVFHVRAELDVFHNDREVEFILCQRVVRERCDLLGSVLGTMSCEQIAADVANDLALRFSPPDGEQTRRISVEVSEDGENGAIVTLA